MFFKKNKPEKSQDQGKKTASPVFEAASPVSSSFSVFAPALNPSAAPIDFGLGNIPEPPSAPSYVVPAPPPNLTSYPQPAQTQWQEESMPAPPDFQPFSPESGAALNESSSLAWDDTPSASAAAPDFSAQFAPPENPAYLGETFENYVPQSPVESSAALHGSEYNPDFFQEIPVDFTPTNALESELQNNDSAPSADWMVGFDESPSLSSFPVSYQEQAVEPLGHAAGHATGDLMPWEDSLSSLQNEAISVSPEALWQNLASGETLPGQQVPLTSAGMLDTLHHTIYPEDPFHTEQAGLLEGQQAFEEAAQFLFPDTMSAPLNWQEDTAISPVQYEPAADYPFIPEGGFELPPMDLGPSIQSDSSSVSDITSFYPEEAQFALPEPIKAPLPADDPFDFSMDYRVEPTSPVEEASNTPELAWPAFENLETESLELPETPFVPVELQQVDPIAEPIIAFDETSFSLDMTTLSSPDDDEGFLSQSFEPEESAFLPILPEEAFTNFAPPSFTAADEGPDEAESAFEGLMPSDAFEPLAFTPQALPVDNVQPDGQASTIMPQLLSDQDFYATAFTLNEFGELIPASEDSNSPLLAPELSLLPPVEAWPPALEPAPLVHLETDDLGFSEVASVSSPPPSTPLAFDASENGLSEHDWLASEILEVPDLARQDAELSLPILEPVPPAFPSFGEAEPELFFEDASADSLLEGLEPVSPFAQMSLPPVLPALPLQPVEEIAVQSVESSFTPQLEPLFETTLPAEPMLESFSLTPPESLEGQWQNEPEAASPPLTEPDGVNPAADELSLNGLQVLSICSLAPDRRLLVVNSDGVFALMGQVGLEQPQISVLKIFESNPLAYQNTFTAVAEVQAAAQGMFVTQVGTWHAIVSTYQDKITLHTELG
ncbi:hypothetical protein [Vampirovibrio sp.]|uniref:hypothetical protein n=1 Tax=Vampirovibrio sp. TaxID=2717857 RepID=UPI0035943485